MKTTTPYFYHVDVRWNKERKGIMCSPELKANSGEHGCIEVATPPEFEKGMQGIWSPEHLFTASVGSCFMTTFLAIAENSKLEFTSFACRAVGKLDSEEGKLMMTEVSLQAEVTIANSNQQELAMRVLQKSERACLISNSIKTKVSMIPAVHLIHELMEQAS
ncbi:MAG: OsmC family protein [Bacteroidetes bacterium]|nr:OsmC family protein [Bacteroidota bacterium]MBI3481861.1 OsmC family protein [Bacteroidota bacterium]